MAVPDGEDLLALLDALGVANAVLVGLSLGARTSLDFTLTHPGRVDGLVLAGPGMSGMTITDPFIRAEATRTMAALKAGDLPGFVDGFLRQWVDGPRRAPSEVDAGIRERCREMAMRTAVAHRRGDAEWIEAGAADRLSELRVPLVALLGDLDSVDIERVVDALAATVPGARKVPVPGAGHMVNLEQPAVFNRELLGKLSPRRPSRSACRSGSGP